MKRIQFLLVIIIFSNRFGVNKYVRGHLQIPCISMFLFDIFIYIFLVSFNSL